MSSPATHGKASRLDRYTTTRPPEALLGCIVQPAEALSVPPVQRGCTARLTTSGWKRIRAIRTASRKPKNQAASALEEAVRRACDRHPPEGEPLYEHQYSDQLLIRLLETNNPERFKRRSERVDFQFSGDVTTLSDEQLAELGKSYAGAVAAAKLLRAAPQTVDLEPQAPEGYPQLTSAPSADFPNWHIKKRGFLAADSRCEKSLFRGVTVNRVRESKRQHLEPVCD